jgi:hypothetical protein
VIVDTGQQRPAAIADCKFSGPQAQMAFASETALDYLFAGQASPGAVTPQGAVIPYEPRASGTLSTPQSRLELPALALHAPAAVLEMPVPVRAGVPLLPVAPEHETLPPFAPELAAGVRAGVGAPQASHTLSTLDRMIQIKVSLSQSGMDRVALEPGLIDAPANQHQALMAKPCSRLAGVFSFPEENSVFCLPCAPAHSQRTHLAAPGETTPLWAELPKLLPRTAFSVVEDSEMREAVRAFSAVMAKEGRKPWLSNIHLPQISFRFRPGDSKWLMMSVPVVLLLGVYSLTDRGTNVAVHQLPPTDKEVVEVPAVVTVDKEHLAADNPLHVPVGTVPQHSTPGAPAPLQNVSKPGMFTGLQQSILKRAAISMSDDFRSGLGEWEGKGDWSKAWSYDDAGFLRAGPLALYKPSMNLTDYRMEFLGQIEKKAIGWVFRATDLNNYYGMKVVLVGDGYMPRPFVEHYAVIDGKEQTRTRRPVPFTVQREMFYRFAMDVHGNGFTLTIQGQVADHWSDDRLQHGGIGFYSGKGEQSRLRWVDLSHQYDFLGRLCAFLAPYGLPAGGAK